MFSFEIDDQIGLRLHETWHAEALFELTEQNREHLKPWFVWVEETQELADTRDFIRRARTAYAERRAVPTSIWVDGQLAGAMGFNGLDRGPGRAEIGYWLGKDYEGRGIVTRCCRKLISYGFEKMGLRRVVLRCATENKRSKAVAERLGFTHEGTLRDANKIDGRWLDLMVYSMLKSEWNGG